MSEPQDIPRGKRMPTPYLFLVNGIASLLGYNALLTSLDYFNFVYKGYDVYSLFLPPVFAGYVLIVLTYRWLSEKFTYKFLITTGILICNVALLMFLIFSLTCRDSPGFGFSMSLLMCFFLGLGSNMYQLTFFAEINYLSGSTVSKFTVGTALSGLWITLLRMIIISIAGTDNSLTAPIILYFVIAILFNFFTLFSNLTFFRSREYTIKIVPYLKKSQEDMSEGLTTESGEENREKQSIKPSKEQSERERQEDMSYLKILLNTAKSIFPYPIIIFSNYIITFLVFPNLTINKKYENLEFVWSSLLFLFTYNVGDTIGKFICDYRWTFNSYSVIYMFASRAYFIIVIPLLATTVFNDDSLVNNFVFPYLVQLLFSITNGVVTNGSFIQSFEICPLRYKKYAGVLNGIMLQIGILVGTNIAIPFAKLFITGEE